MFSDEKLAVRFPDSCKKLTTKVYKRLAQNSTSSVYCFFLHIFAKIHYSIFYHTSFHLFHTVYKNSLSVFQNSFKNSKSAIATVSRGYMHYRSENKSSLYVPSSSILLKLSFTAATSSL